MATHSCPLRSAGQVLLHLPYLRSTDCQIPHWSNLRLPGSFLLWAVTITRSMLLGPTVEHVHTTLKVMLTWLVIYQINDLCPIIISHNLCSSWRGLPAG